MGDLQFWIYVLAIVIYVISRAFKKPAQNPEMPPQQPERRQRVPDGGETARTAPPVTSSAPRQLTFEELLQEISESKAPKRPEPRPLEDAFTSYDDELKEEAEDLEDEGFDYSKKDSVYEVYEDAKRQAFLRPSLEETMSNADTDVRFGRFKEFEQKEERNLMQVYLSGLNDPEGLKKAFVLSEVFQRKF